MLNEIVASNTLGHSDIVDFEDYSDWIELRNTTGAEVSLDGYFLSDDPADPFKWAVPSGGSIGANGYFLIWADSHDAGPGETHARGYWPWVDFTTEGYHTNFNLSADGETLTLTKAVGITSQVLIAAEDTNVPGAVWKYLDDGSDQSTQWRARTFDDSGWASGASQLGYGDGDEQTQLGYGGNSNNKYITTYFRHTFNVADPARFHGLSARMLADDGAVVYLNGVEVQRVRVADGDYNYLTRATGTFTEGVYEPFNIPRSLLIAGDNVIAVEIHQVQANSSDISFDFELTGYSHTSSTQEDSVTFGAQLTDVSYGRDPANPTSWVYFGEPSPVAENNTSIVPAARVVSSDVEFSLAAGFYSGTQSLSLSTADGGAQIHYTLNGDLPDSSSPVYSSALTVASTTVVRARAIAPGKVPGVTGTRTYFFGETPGDVSFVSVVTDDANLFDPVKGIYYNTHEPLTEGVAGVHNVYKGKEVPISFEFFGKDGTLAQAVNAGARIGGENNWRHKQKALTIYMRGKYGDDLFEYPLFDSVPCVGSLGRFVLRNGGDNWTNSMLRDAMIPGIVEGRMENDPMAYRPCVVFINGDYWGIHNLREKFDGQYFVSRYHVDADNYDHCEFGHITSSSTTFGVAAGNSDHYLAMEDFVINNDMSIAANYAFVESQLDIDSLIDYAVIQDYVYNSSWSHNREFWRERKPGAKWRWLLPDLDRGFNGSYVTSNLLDNLVNEYALFGGMMDNPGFRNRLIQRYCAHMASTFNATRIAGIVDALDGEVSGEVARHIAKWSPEGGMTAAKRTAELQEIKDFAVQRPAEVLIDLTSQFSLGATATLTLAQSSSAAGKIYINGVFVSPEVSMVTLYTGIPFELKAVANPGYAFTGWTGATGGAGTTLTLTGDLSVTALFSNSTETIAPSTVSSDTTLAVANSPYVSEGDIVVDANTTLTIEPGVELHMPAGANIRVLGSLQVLGTDIAPVNILARDTKRWGGISFENATAASQLNHLTIRGASKGPHALVYKAAISALNSTLVMDGLDLDEVDFPIFTRGGNITLRNSRIHTTVTCDYINIKSGVGAVTGNTFIGNNAPDTDAVDFDDVVNGIIHDNYIYRFRGFNSDGIDIGEGCVDISVEGNKIYYNSDKGVSVGQASTVVMKRNVIVGCNEAVAVKDTGSAVTVDQCTLVDNQIGVSSFEKNFLKGGGAAIVMNTIIAGSGVAPVQVDALSTLSVSYSASDTLPLVGTGNLNLDPQFTDSTVLNYELLAGSPCIDAGDPTHALDPDSSRADIGALYAYVPGDYPFTLEQVVVVNEVLANSGAAGSDWIELHNRSGAEIDISGWFLSDSASDYAKYRIPNGTVIPAGGYVTFYEDAHFGAASIDPGRITAFAFSENGETAYLHSAVSDELTDYLEQEKFGASRKDISHGYYHKESTGTYNFLALKYQTPSAANSSPAVGPIVISEIMYHPSTDGDAEYIELLNITDAAVTLYDAATGTAWKISDGVEYEFSKNSPVTLVPGERILLVKNLAVFNATYSVPAGTQLFEWTTGSLSNGGERVQLVMPGGLDGSGARQYIRIDRVNYADVAPWATTPDGGGPALSKIFETEYGNDAANWSAATASPATYAAGASYAQWAADESLPAGKDGPLDDPDGDGLDNLTEYTLGTDAMVWTMRPGLGETVADGQVTLEFDVDTTQTDVDVWIEQSETLEAGSWTVSSSTPVSYTATTQRRRVTVTPKSGGRIFYRYVTRKKP
ncbi:MAG: lamin tail domain-containing protein [Akkermansiaceae bacterium]|nr:lamin tail domain-containing protein [Akkermansiaceae bacterium]